MKDRKKERKKDLKLLSIALKEGRREKNERRKEEAKRRNSVFTRHYYLRYPGDLHFFFRPFIYCVFCEIGRYPCCLSITC